MLHRNNNEPSAPYIGAILRKHLAPEKSVYVGFLEIVPDNIM